MKIYQVTMKEQGRQAGFWPHVQAENALEAINKVDQNPHQSREFVATEVSRLRLQLVTTTLTGCHNCGIATNLWFSDEVAKQAYGFSPSYPTCQGCADFANGVKPL